MDVSVLAQLWGPELLSIRLAASGGDRGSDRDGEQGDGASAEQEDGTVAEHGNDGVEPLVTVRLLGGFRVYDAQGGRTEPSGLPADVVKIVALRGRIHVEEVVEMLWRGLDPGSGRRRLRNVLSRLRRVCGPVVEREQETLVLGEGVVVDVHRFETDAQQALMLGADDPRAAALAGSAVALYHGNLLPGDLFRDWTTAPRERLRRRFVDAVDLLADVAASRGEVEEALLLLEQCIELEPYDEQRYLRATRMLADAGRRGAAAMMLRRARAVLEELGLTPSAQHRELEERLRRG